MPTMQGRHRLILAVATLVAVLGLGVFITRWTMFVLDAPPPLLLADVEDTLAALPPSIVEEPVTFDLQTVMDSLEAAVPATYGDLDQRIPTPTNRRVSFAFLVHRSPFRLKVVGQTVFLSADIEYSGRIWYKPTLGPAVEVSCGTGNDLPRRATLTLECTGDLTADWGVRTHSRVLRLTAYSDSSRDHCRLSFLRIDVTQRVLEKTYRMINEKLGDFDAVVARWPVRRRFEKVWRDLQKPMRLADSVYMTIGPSEAQVGSIGAIGKVAFANLRLKAAPRIVTGPRPRFAPVPLPPLTRERDAGHGARVLLEASFQYPIATLILRKALVGLSVSEMGRKVRIRDVRLSGIGAGKVALGVRVAGAVRGQLFFTGTPSLDLPSHQIVIRDLDYDVGTAGLLVKSYEWLQDMSLRDTLRLVTQLPDSVVLDPLSVLAERGMNRDLPARGTHLSGRIYRASMIGVHATRADLRVRAVADADLTISIKRAPRIPRPPEPEESEDEETGQQ